MAFISSDSLDGLYSTLYAQAANRSSLASSAITRGAQRLQKQDYTGALAEFKRAAAYQPDRVEPHLYAGRVYDLMGRNDEAIAQYREAVRLAPADTEARNALAGVYVKAGRWGEAEQEYQRLAFASPASAGPATSLGLVYMRTDRYDDALAQFEKVARIVPNDAVAHYNVGLALNQLGRFDEAVDAFDTALRIDPRSATARADLAHAYIGLGREDEAQQQADLLAAMNTAESVSLATEVGLTLLTPRIAYADIGRSTFTTAYGPGALVSSFAPELATPGGSKVFSMTFQFNQAMDLVSVQDIFHWSIRRADGGTGGVYDHGASSIYAGREVDLMPVPISVRYDPLQHTATLYFKVTQNAAGDGVMDPSHWVFRFSGTDAAGNAMDPRFDEYDGWAHKPF